MGEPSHTEFIAVLWVFVGICIVLVAARLAVRTWKGMWRFWLSEVWLTLAVASFTVLVGGSQYAWSKGLPDWSVRDDVGYNKWKFCLTLICEVGYYFPRFSLLAFYNELFPISEERLRKVMWGTIVFTTLAFIMDGLLVTFWCGLPVSKNWSTNPDDCAIYMVSEIFEITWPVGMTAELLIFALPFGMFRRLKATPRREQVALLGLFSVGLLTVIMSTLRFVYTMQSIFTYSTTIISSAEIVSQIFVCAVPALRPLLPVMTVGWTRLASVVTGRDYSAEEDERTLQGSYAPKEIREKDMNQGNLAELGEWNSEEGNSVSLTDHQQQPADDRRS